MFHALWHHAQYINLGGTGRKGGHLGLRHLSSQVSYASWSPAFLGVAEHLPAHEEQQMNFWFCLHTRLLFYVLNWFYINLRVFSLLAF